MKIIQINADGTEIHHEKKPGYDLLKKVTGGIYARVEFKNANGKGEVWHNDNFYAERLPFNAKVTELCGVHIQGNCFVYLHEPRKVKNAT